VSASVNLSLHHKAQKFFLPPAHPGGPGKRAVKRLWVFYGAFEGNDSAEISVVTFRSNEIMSVRYRNLPSVFLLSFPCISHNCGMEML